MALTEQWMLIHLTLDDCCLVYSGTGWPHFWMIKIICQQSILPYISATFWNSVDTWGLVVSLLVKSNDFLSFTCHLQMHYFLLSFKMSLSHYLRIFILCSVYYTYIISNPYIYLRWALPSKAKMFWCLQLILPKIESEK